MVCFACGTMFNLHFVLLQYSSGVKNSTSVNPVLIVAEIFFWSAWFKPLSHPFFNYGHVVDNACEAVDVW